VTLNCPANQQTRPNEQIIKFSHEGSGGLISISRLASGELMVGVYRLDDMVEVAVVYDSGKKTLVGAHLRELSPVELADLPEEWENPTVDTSKYYQNVGRVWETNEETYLSYKQAGHLCQKHEGRYYVA
jgi:hypothetical protein